MMELNIEIEGAEESDLEMALEEVLRKVRQGYRSGFDSNDSGRFNFDVSGSPESELRALEAGSEQ